MKLSSRDESRRCKFVMASEMVNVGLRLRCKAQCPKGAPYPCSTPAWLACEGDPGHGLSRCHTRAADGRSRGGCRTFFGRSSLCRSALGEARSRILPALRSGFYRRPKRIRVVGKTEPRESHGAGERGGWHLVFRIQPARRARSTVLRERLDLQRAEEV